MDSSNFEDRGLVHSVFSTITGDEFFAPEFEALAREWSDHDSPPGCKITPLNISNS